MSNLEDYQAKIETVKAVPDEETKIPNMPVHVFVQEAENKYQWCQVDKELLTAAGLNWAIVEDVPARAGALREAESRWFKERFTRQEAEKEWKEKSPEAYDLRDILLHTLRFAFRRHDDLLGRVSQIAEGSGNADMIQDLNDLSVLGIDHKDLLEAVSFDTARLDEAAATADEMAALLSAATAERGDNNEARLIRDKAYTLLKDAVDEVRTCGQYVFWRDKERFKGYISRYRKRNRKPASVSAEIEAEE